MKLLQFFSFVLALSAVFSQLGILLAFMAFLLKEAYLSSALKTHVESLSKALADKVAQVGTLPRIMVDSSLRVMWLRAAFSLGLAFVLAIATVTFYRSLLLIEELGSASQVLHITYDSVRDRYVPDMLGVQTVFKRPDIDLPVSLIASTLAVQGEKGLVHLSGDDYRSFGVIAYHEGRYDDTIRYFIAASERDPKDYRTLTSLGVAYFQKGELARNAAEKLAWNTRAIDAHKKAIEIKPKFAIAYSNLGISLFMVGREEDAIRAEQEAIEVDPNIPESYYNLACIYSLRNEREAALEWLQRAIEKGYENLEEMRSDPTLANVRNTPEYRRLEQRLQTKSR